MDKAIVKTKEAIKSLDDSSGEYPDQVIDYFKFYGLDFENNHTGLKHIFGTFESQGFLLAAHIYKPIEYKATVLLLHGYLNHSAQLKNLIGFLISNNFAVAIFDLPGHGLSGGQPAAIEDFSQYSQALADFRKTITKYLEGPYHLIGFSTGASAAMDFLFVHGRQHFDRVILAAPLVRHIAWRLSKTGCRLCGAFTNSLPRLPHKDSSDKQYRRFIKTDPLQGRTVPLKWVRALHQWNERIADYPTCDAQVKVIQGTGDTTVDWKFNTGFIKNKFSLVDMSFIENCRHELFNESANLRKKVFSQITLHP